MCLLLETIKLENGELRNLEYHNRRFNSSRLEKFGIAEELDLGTHIRVPENAVSGVYRCRVLYRSQIEEIQFVPHEERIVRSLKLVQCEDVDYAVKYADRDRLMSLFELRGDCDEILIIKQGYITDTSISNITFRLPDGSWITPDTPLLKGTMRMHLLETGRLTEASVRPGDLGRFSGAKMINALSDLDSAPMIPMDKIFD